MTEQERFQGFAAGLAAIETRYGVKVIAYLQELTYQTGDTQRTVGCDLALIADWQTPVPPIEGAETRDDTTDDTGHASVPT